MKKTLLIALFFSINSFAGFVAESKINNCDRFIYSDLSSCQEVESDKCYETPSFEKSYCGVYKLKNIHSEISVNEESCLGESCLQLLNSKVCSVNHTAFINEDFTAVYCREIIGKELIVDQVLKAQKEAEDLARDQANAIVELGARGKADCEKVLNLVRGYNLQPDRDGASESMKAEFVTVMELLEKGQPKLAKAAIELLEVDGTLVTQTMKSLALDYLKDW